MSTVSIDVRDLWAKLEAMERSQPAVGRFTDGYLRACADLRDWAGTQVDRRFVQEGKR